MTPTEYKAALTALGLSQARLGRLVKVSRDTPTNWTKGPAIPGAVSLILLAMQSGLVTIEQLEALNVGIGDVI